MRTRIPGRHLLDNQPPLDPILSRGSDITVPSDNVCKRKGSVEAERRDKNVEKEICVPEERRFLRGESM